MAWGHQTLSPQVRHVRGGGVAFSRRGVSIVTARLRRSRGPSTLVSPVQPRSGESRLYCAVAAARTPAAASR